MTLRWKKEPKETGLLAVFAGPRSSWLHDGLKRYACVSALRKNYKVIGWYWLAGWDSDVPHMNTYNDPTKSEGEAKKEAAAYVKEYLKGSSK